MRQNRPIRFAHEGADPSESRKIVGVGHSRVDRSKIYIQKVNTIEQYEAGCREHENCLGHMVEAPSGLLLPPQYMGLRTNIMKNEVYEAAQHAFAPISTYHYKEYKRILTKMMSGKEGKMRSNVLVSPVDGSLRMVVVPHTEGDENGMFECNVTKRLLPCEKVIFLPYYLQDKFKVIRVNKETGRYVSDYVKNGDSAYLVREPALHAGSTPFVYVFYWRKKALGAHPVLMKGLKGDYDGDELQLYPIYSDDAIAICDRWQVEPHPDFEKANKIYNENYYPDRCGGPLDFMWHTTMSFKEIKNSHPPPLMCEYNRMTLQHINMFRGRYNTSETSRTLIESSVEGLNSINVQQHSQPIVGDMSRIARLAASSIIQTQDGMINIMEADGLTPIYQSSLDQESGNTAVRAESRLCATAQQVMLSAHRVTKSSMPSHDMIKDLVVGSLQSLISVKSEVFQQANTISAESKYVSWMAKLGNLFYILCNPEVITYEMRKFITSAYNPYILSYIPKSKRFRICRKGIENVFLQYEIPVSDVELDCLAVLYSYKVENSKAPITSRQGLSERPMHWVDTVMATSFYTLTKMVNKNDIAIQPVNTISSALMVKNFDLV